MTKKLQISQILVYYDVPEIFIADDEVGTKFLCLLVDLVDDSIQYIATPISSIRLSDFIIGNEDLRTIFTAPETNQLYFFDSISDTIEARIWQESELPEEFLPAQGFKYEKAVDDTDILIEANEKKNAIIHLAISDNRNSNSVGAEDLGDIIKLYQSIIENSFKKEITRAEAKEKKAYLMPQNYKLRAFAASPGSFNMHLFSTSQIDLFGNAIIEIALNKFDEITQDILSNDEYIESLRTVKGHTISSLRRLVKKIMDDDIVLNHKWYSPGQDKVHSCKITKTKAQQIFEILNLSEELTEERREFQGHFVQVDVEKGTWRILNHEDNKEYSGEVYEDLLQGITVETAVYKIICIEIVEELKVTEKEKVRYILKDIFRVD